MAVYVDDMFLPAKVPGMRPAIWCHMQADTVEELHAFAARLGLKRSWFQSKPGRPDHDHYDVTKSVRAKAVALGAVEETIEEGVERRKRMRELQRLI